MKPKVLVFSGYGLNCEEETQHAFTISGADAEIVHINDVIDGKKKLSQFQILAFPGGFSYGDDTGSGNAFANRIRNHLWNDLQKFIKEDKLIIGICNGFQILSRLGLLPAFDYQYGETAVALMHNESARYSVRWVDLKVESDSPWLKKLDMIPVAIAHGEGKLYADEQKLKNLRENNQIALRYVSGEICDYLQLEPNPNGALENIAGITDPSGRIFGLMPHPERAMYFTHLPHWTYLKEKLMRENKEIPQFAPGLQIFRNGVEYFADSPNRKKSDQSNKELKESSNRQWMD